MRIFVYYLLLIIIVEQNLSVNQQKQTNLYDIVQKEFDILSSIMFLSKNQHRRTKYYQHLQKVLFNLNYL